MEGALSDGGTNRDLKRGFQGASKKLKPFSPSFGDLQIVAIMLRLLHPMKEAITRKKITVSSRWFSVTSN